MRLSGQGRVEYDSVQVERQVVIPQTDRGGTVRERIDPAAASGKDECSAAFDADRIDGSLNVRSIVMI
jgi:hypothetical protein